MGDDSRRDGGGSTRERAALAACCLLLVVLSAWSGLGWNLHHDEGVTLDVAVGRVALDPLPASPVPLADLAARADGSTARGPAAVVAALQERAVPHPPLYYVLVAGWARLFGTSPWVLRLPNLLLGLLFLLGLARLADRLLGAGTGRWAALLAAASPLMHVMITYARPYALVQAITVWATLTVVSQAPGPRDEEPAAPRRRGAWTAFVLLSLAGLATLYHYGFVIAWHLALLGWWGLTASPGDRRRRLLAAGSAAACILAALVAWLPVLREHLALSGAGDQYYSGLVGATDWPGQALRAGLVLLLGDAVQGVGADTVVTSLLVLAVLTAGALVVRALRALRGRRASREGAIAWAPAFWGTALLVPGLTAASDVWRHTRTLFLWKTTFALFPLMILLLVAAFTGWSRRRAGRVVLTGWALVLLAGTASTVFSHDRYVDHHAELAVLLGRADEPDHVVVVNSLHRGHLIPLVLTLREAGLSRLQVAYAPGERLVEDLRDDLLDAADVKRVTLLNLYAIHGSDDQTWSREQLWAACQQGRQAGWRVQRASPQRAVERALVPRAGTLLVIAPVR